VKVSRVSRGNDLRYNLRVTRRSFCRFGGENHHRSGCNGNNRNGTGAEGGSEPQTCPTHSPRHVRAQQGFFTVERTCPTCVNGMGRQSKPQGSSRCRARREREIFRQHSSSMETGTRIRLPRR
jgi:molecular chaperone DnaJ